MIIIGGGSHCSDIEAIAARCNIRIWTVYDENPDLGWPAPPSRINGPLIIGVNSPTTRKEIAERYPHARGAAPLIDPSAIIGPDVHYGHGCVVAPLASLLTHVKLGDHVHVNYHASMTRCTVGNYTTISPAATICGDVDIGEATLIGAGAVVADRSVVGSEVTVGAGAIVPPCSFVPDGSRVIGVWRR